MIHFFCPVCSKVLKAKPEDAGRKCKCSTCNHVATIPSGSTAPAPKPEIMPPVAEHYRQSFEEIASTPIVQANDSKPARVDMVVRIQKFLVLCAVLISICVLICIVTIMDGDRRPEKWYFVGYFIGSWFAFMLGLANIWLMTEVVLAIRSLRRE